MASIISQLEHVHIRKQEIIKASKRIRRIFKKLNT